MKTITEEQQVRLDAFNHAARITLTLWFTLSEAKPHHALYEEFRILAEWLVVEHKNMMSECFDEVPWFPEEQGQDICGTCYNLFHTTRGGRVRDGCSTCNDEGALFSSQVYRFKHKLFVGNAHMEWLYAGALALWSEAKPRQVQRTPKWYQENNAFIGPEDEVLYEDPQKPEVAVSNYLAPSERSAQEQSVASEQQVLADIEKDLE